MYSSFSFKRMGPAVKGLLMANGVLFVFQQWTPGFLEHTFGLVPSQVWGHFFVWQIFTYQFLHGNFFHLLFNMFALWMFGKELEYQWGKKEFLKFYFICALGAGVLNVLADPFSTIPVIGASGAIYGLLVAFAMVFPEALIYLYGIFPMRARHFVIMIGAIEFFASMGGSPSLMARFAHLGGMLTGYCYLKSYTFRSFWNSFFYKVLNSIVLQAQKPKMGGERTRANLDPSKELDRILDKVLLKGPDSLTEEEREFMRRYSKTNH